MTTFRRPSIHILLLLPFLLLSIKTSIVVHGAALEQKESIYFEQKMDAQQVLLIQTTNNGTLVETLQSVCGSDMAYATSAMVLGVNRTVDPSLTALGAANEGRVVEMCGLIQFKTTARYFTKPDCDDWAMPGRKLEGWCGYVFLTPGMGRMDPYVPAAGVRSFEEVDISVCEAAGKVYCPEYVAFEGTVDSEGNAIVPEKKEEKEGEGGADKDGEVEEDPDTLSGAPNRYLAIRSGVVALISLIAFGFI
mmetsp:Transcript_28078/g.59275  ORF Transcript_28078/g.59275 Transcript_28078/m.59275 type:complete len:249 (+) Transcript_28078:199-945(+)